MQAAEVFVRAEGGAAGVEDLRFLSSERTGEAVWRVRFSDARTGRVHEARISCRPSGFSNPITCHSEEEKSITQFFLEEYGTEAGK